METFVKWAWWLVPLLGVAGAGMLVLSYLNEAWLNMALGALMLAAYLVITNALGRRSRQPFRPQTKSKHRKH